MTLDSIPVLFLLRVVSAAQTGLSCLVGIKEIFFMTRLIFTIVSECLAETVGNNREQFDPNWGHFSINLRSNVYDVLNNLFGTHYFKAMCNSFDNQSCAIRINKKKNKRKNCISKSIKAQARVTLAFYEVSNIYSADKRQARIKLHRIYAH